MVVVVVRGHAPAGVVAAVKGGRRHRRCGQIVFPVPWPLPLSAAQSGERGQADGHAAIVDFKVGSGGLIVAEQVESMGLNKL